MSCDLRLNGASDADGSPSEEQLRRALNDFQCWVSDRETDVPRVRLAEVSGISRSALYALCDSGELWTSGKRSLYWTWLERRCALRDMKASDIRRRTLEFRAVSDKLGKTVPFVSRSWWENKGYSGLGVEVRGEGDEVEIVTLPKGEGEAVDDAYLDDGGDGEDVLSGGSAEELPDEFYDGDYEDDDVVGDDDDVAGDTDNVSGDALASDDDDFGDEDLVGGTLEYELLPADDTLVENLPTGQTAERAMRRFTVSQKDFLVSRVNETTTVAEVALIAGTPVLALVPGLTLEAAKEGGLLRVSGWNPGHPARDEDGVIREYRVGPVGGLWGDGINMLYFGEEAEYADDGARLVAFAPETAWGPDERVWYYAQQMRTGVTMKDRRRKHAVSDHDGRGLYFGYRMANWAPERKYPDSDWFFGSEGALDVEAVRRLTGAGRLFPDDLELLSKVAEWDVRRIPLRVRRPSRAEVLARWYAVRAIADAFADVERFATSAFGLAVERERLLVERTMLSDEYAITPYYYGEGRSIPDSTRVSERRWMLERIGELTREVARARRRLKVRRFFGSLFLGWARALRRRMYVGRHERLRGEGIVPGKEGDPTIETEEFKSAGLGVGIEETEFDWNDYESLSELPGELRFGSRNPEDFCGLDYTKWGVPKVPLVSRHRDHWFTFIPPDADVAPGAEYVPSPGVVADIDEA